MSLRPETIARLQGILDGTIKVIPTTAPVDLSTLKPETRNRIAELLNTPQPVTPPVPTSYVEEEIVQEEPDAEELRNADDVIETLTREGHGDYSAFRREIALDIYSNGHYAGNDTAQFVVSDYDEASTLSDFYVIQEDHYDQHMDEDPDKPSWDSMVGSVANGYLWMN